MKSKYLIVVFFYIAIQFSNAQSSLIFDKLFTVGIHLTKTEYSGDLGNSIWNPKPDKSGLTSYWYYWGGGLSFSVNPNRSFFFSADANYGAYGYNKLDYTGTKFFANTKKIDFTTTAHYKLNNGYIFKEDGVVAPFFSLGVGVAQYFRKDQTTQKYNAIRGIDFVYPFGGGIQFNISKDLAVRYQYLFYFTNKDNLDGISGGINDFYGQHMGSIIYSFGDVVRKIDCHCNF